MPRSEEKQHSLVLVKRYILEDPPTTEDLAYLDEVRPKTRGDCVNGIRPCPFVGCRYNVFLETNQKGSITLNFKDKVPETMNESCALDVADQFYGAGCTLEKIGEVLNLTRERVRQIEFDCKSILEQDNALKQYHEGINDAATED